MTEMSTYVSGLKLVPVAAKPIDGADQSQRAGKQQDRLGISSAYLDKLHSET